MWLQRTIFLHCKSWHRGKRLIHFDSHFATVISPIETTNALRERRLPEVQGVSNQLMLVKPRPLNVLW